MIGKEKQHKKYYLNKFFMQVLMINTGRLCVLVRVHLVKHGRLSQD